MRVFPFTFSHSFCFLYLLVRGWISLPMGLALFASLDGADGLGCRFDSLVYSLIYFGCTKSVVGIGFFPFFIFYTKHLLGEAFRVFRFISRWSSFVFSHFFLKKAGEMCQKEKKKKRERLFSS